MVLTAGVASAEITLSGGGFVGFDTDANGDRVYDSRFDLNVDGSIESESGIGVSARFRIRNENDGVADFSDPRINVTAGALTLSFGNTDSAIRARSNPWASCVGNLGDDCGGSVFGGGFDSDGAGTTDRVRLDYTAESFTVSASTTTDGAEDLELGVSASMNGMNLNVGYKMEDATPATYALDLNGAFGSVNAGVRYDRGQTGGVSNDAVATLYGNTTFGATTAGIYLTDDDANAWGVGMSHDLGGGVAFGAAVADGDQAQAHISFSF